MKDIVKIGKIGEFIVYLDNVDGGYIGERIVTKEIIRADTIEELKDRALNYRDELADYFSDLVNGFKNQSTKKFG